MRGPIGGAALGPRATRPFGADAMPPKRHPYLDALFDRMIKACGETLRGLGRAPAQLTLAEMRTERIGAVLDAHEDQAVAVLVRAVEWDCGLVFLVDRDYLAALGEFLFGGDGSDRAAVADRPFTEIDLQIARSAAGDAARALSGVLASLGPLTLVPERTETKLAFAMAEERATPAILARLRLETLGFSGTMSIVIPQTALARLQQPAALPAPARRPPPPADPVWAKSMSAAAGYAGVKLSAVLEERAMPLGRVARLKVGDIIPLQADPQTLVRLDCDGRAMFLCRFGQSGGRYTLLVEQQVAAPRSRP